MEVRLLGPLTVEDGGRRIPLGGVRQRAVFSMLALHADEAVPSERMLVDLWGPDAPPRAVNALQACVSRLRRVLPEGRLVTSGRAYLLRLWADELDVRRFERLAARGRHALVGGAAFEAARLLRQALSLWRGPALADFRYEPFAQGEISRLEEMRLACLEERIEADLALGGGVELAGELRQLVAEQPLREKLRGQLMLALYRSGRQADALDAYVQLRNVVLEELGQEPLPALRELQAAILRQDPTLEAATPIRSFKSSPLRKPVTVACVRLAVAAKSSVSVDPEAMQVVLARVLGIISSAFQRHGGTLVVGTAERIVGVFGVPVLHEDDALRAARATLTARGALASASPTLDLESGVGLSVRFGLATGEALVDPADPGGMSGEVMGRAAELADLADAGEILVSNDTQLLAAGALIVEPAGPRMYRLQAAQMTARAVPVRLDAPLVGRSEELRRLRDAFGLARQTSRAVLVTVLGEPGVGKSRLAHELSAQLADQATLLTGHCLPYGTGITFWPVRELVRQAGASQITREGIGALLSGEADGALVTEHLAGALIPGDQGAQQPVEIFWAIRRLLEILARRRPLLVIFEDVHWAEPTFLDLLDSLATHLEQPALLLCLSRPELVDQRPSGPSGATRTITVELEPLTHDEAAALLAKLVRTAPREPVRRRLLEAAAGYPFHLEQLAASLDEQSWSEDDPPIPLTIRALLNARLERLGPGERAALECAAVFGRDFSLQPIAALMPREARRSLRRHLEVLIARGLVQPVPTRPDAGEAFRFRHILIQYTMYSTIPKSRRADLHERLAGWLQQHVGEHDEIVGYHLARASGYCRELSHIRRARSLGRRAARRLEAAGTGAHARGDIPAAVRLLDRAASLFHPNDSRLAWVLTCLSAALIEAKQLDRADDVLDRAEGLAEASGVERRKAHARVQRLLLGLQVDPHRATAAVGGELPGLFEVFEHAADQLGLCRAWHLRAAVWWNQANSGAAEAAWEEAAVHARRAGERRPRRAGERLPRRAGERRPRHAGDRRQLVEILGWLASAALWGPTPAPDGIRKCEKYLKEVGSHRSAQAVVLLHLAGLYALQDRRKEAHAVLARSQAIYHDLTGTMASAVTEPAAFVATLAGDLVTAERLLRTEYEELDRMGEKSHLATIGALLARTITMQGAGRHAEAEIFITASQRAAQGEDLSTQIIGQGALARILTARNDLGTAVDLAGNAVALAQSTDLLNQHADALLDLAHVLEAANRPDEAHQAIREALALYRQKGNKPGIRNAVVLLA